jgi:saccharopine dehydrogenase-like NADP-dependent oxidoreductase
VLLLNEIGLDPGIDHMSAVHLLDRIRAAGGRVTHFSSCCGGLPSPDANDNPWGYKFSWSPRGVLLAGRNPARFLRDGSVVEIEGRHLFSHHWSIQLEGLGPLEVYPNRDCLSYARTYRLNGIRNLFRGTIRWPGWCETLGAAAVVGLLDPEERDWDEDATWGELTTRFVPGTQGSARSRLARRLGIPGGHPLLAKFTWAGLLSDEPLPRTRASALDLFCERLQQSMRYAPGERDMVVMRHDVRYQNAEGGFEQVESSLIVQGEPGGDSAMARTVSLPAAIAARRILDGKIHAIGVTLPVEPEIYRPVLAEIDALGIRFRETRRREAGVRRG